MRNLLSTQRSTVAINTFYLAVWFGLLTGLGEVVLHGVKKFLLHKALHLSPHVVWMAPLMNVVIFVFAGVFLLILTRRWDTIRALGTTAGVFAFLGFLSLLFMYPRLHAYAVVLLAGGLAVQTACLIAPHQSGFSSLVRRTFVWLIAVVVALTVGTVGPEKLAETVAVAKLPPANPNAPNVLLIVLDTVRAQSLSVYGYERPTTPQLERLSKSGVLFDGAIATSPWTLPSHGSMFTGRLPHELGVDWVTPLDARFPTLAEALSEHGYLTAGFVANTLYCHYEFGLNRGFKHYEDFHVSAAEVLRSTSLGNRLANVAWVRSIFGNYDILGRKTAARVNNGFLNWLSSNSHRPFFAFLNYFDAHTPYLPPEPFALRFAQGVRPLKAWSGTPRKWSPKEIRAEQDAYDGAIAYLDYHIGMLTEELAKRGLLENTLMIVTSDHGEAFSEHGFMGHGNSLYLPELHVPLFLRFPSQIPAGKRIVEPVSLRDLPATVVDLLELSGKVRLPGESLSRYWNESEKTAERKEQVLISEGTGETSLPSWYPASKGDMRSLLSHPYHYIKNGDGREELYNIDLDVAQRHDLAGSTKSAHLLESFRRLLDGFLKGDRSR